MRVILRCDEPGAVDHDLYSRFATITPGAPGRCPECDAFGYIEQADLARHVQSQRCRTCGYQWAYRFDPDGRLLEVAELAAARPRVIDLTVDTREGTSTTS